MRILSLAAIGVAAIASSSAFGADLAYPVKAPPMVAASTYDWTGFYIGLHGGYGWGRAADFAQAPVNYSHGGGFGGAQIGYNWQTRSGFVLGVEADVSGASITGSQVVAPLAAVNSAINVFGTARGRVGYVFGNMLFYGTGGFAWARNSVTVTGGGPGGGNIADAKFHTGWTAGGGLEWGISGNWSAKVEYLYARYGSEDYFFPQLPSGRLELNTVKVGVNYRFGGDAPIIARY